NPVHVQGSGAAQEIAVAIREFASPSEIFAPLDLLVVTRGGGSIEDLWEFNEEIVARAIFHSTVPVVSAVGHEIDFTICDFVADLRAATPSAAAEIITEGVFASQNFLSQTAPYLRQLIDQRLAQDKESLRQLSQRLGRLHPRTLLNERLQYLDELQSALVRCARQG